MSYQKELPDEVEFAQKFYNERIGINEWIITNEGGGTKIVIRDTKGYKWAYRQLSDETVKAINIANGHDREFVQRVIAHSF